MKKVYFDSVATTSLNPEVSKTYKKLLDEYYCNSDALYDDGVAIYRMMETSRKNIANMLKVDEREVIFTSGASEANSRVYVLIRLRGSILLLLFTSIPALIMPLNSLKKTLVLK